MTTSISRHPFQYNKIYVLQSNITGEKFIGKLKNLAIIGEILSGVDAKGIHCHLPIEKAISNFRIVK